MKLNNKGFAISGVLYPIFVLFLILLFGTISNLATAKAVIDRNKIDIEKQLNGDNVNPYFVMDGHDITINTGYSYTETTGVKAYSSEGKELGLEQITVTSVPAFNNSATGVYNITYSVTDARGRTTIDTKKVTVATQLPSIYNYTGDVQTFTTTKKGVYKIELWGASGGNGNSALANNGTIVYGGKGGYVSGVISLNSEVNLYLYVGGQGTNNVPATNVAGGWNGGGTSGKDSQGGGGGGGATDVRLSNGTWNDILSLRSRIMVAGAGGGSSTWTNGTGGGNSGGLIAYGGNLNPGSVAHTLATGGTQISGGTPGGSAGIGTAGAFGYGGNAEVNHGGGGGAGYYGGGGSGYISSGVSSGAGGSSFISGHTGCNSIDSLGAHTSQPDHFSGYTFTNTLIQDGSGYLWTSVKGLQQQMPKPTGDLYPLGSGHMGHGFAEITPLLTINIE